MDEDQIDKFLFICAGRCTAKENECFHGQKERVSYSFIPILVGIFYPRMATLFPRSLLTCPEEKVVAEVGLLEERLEKKKE